jgi:DUF1680 family protein
MYAVAADEAAIHLYGDSTARLTVAGVAVTLTQATTYPWDGRVALTVGVGAPARFGLALRVPGWCDAPALTINGEPVSADLVNGYYRIRREWRDGDSVVLDLPMAVRALRAHPKVRADIGRVALARGPLIYCAEAVDNGADLNAILVSDTAAAKAETLPALNGAVAIDMKARRERVDGWDGTLYDTRPPARDDATLRLVPYHLWDNREPGEMLVWIRTE